MQFFDQVMPWWDFRVALDSIENSYQFIHGTNAYADGCADVVSCSLLHALKFETGTSLQADILFHLVISVL
jgi:hypothetical protein